LNGFRVGWLIGRAPPVYRLCKTVENSGQCFEVFFFNNLLPSESIDLVAALLNHCITLTSIPPSPVHHALRQQGTFEPGTAAHSSSKTTSIRRRLLAFFPLLPDQPSQFHARLPEPDLLKQMQDLCWHQVRHHLNCRSGKILAVCGIRC
jgi:hypothetical protein